MLRAVVTHALRMKKSLRVEKSFTVVTIHCFQEKRMKISWIFIFEHHPAPVGTTFFKRRPFGESFPMMKYTAPYSRYSQRAQRPSSKDWRHSVCLQWEQGHFYVVALCEDSLWSLPNYKKRVYPFPFFREPELKCEPALFLWQLCFTVMVIPPLLSAPWSRKSHEYALFLDLSWNFCYPDSIKRST